MILIRIIILGGLLLLAGQAQAQIVFRGAASATSASAAGVAVAYGGVGAADVDSGNCPQSISPSIPPGTTAGDLLIAAITSKDDNPLVMNGWNSLYADVQGNGYQVAVYWRIATGADPGTVTKAGGSCNVMVGRITRFTGVDTTTPFDGGVGASYQVDNAITTGSITTSVATSMLVITAHTGDDSNTGAPAGFSEAWESTTGNGSDASVSLKYQLQATAGTKGPFSFSKTRGNDSNHGVLFALRPGPPSLTINVPAGTAANDVMVAILAVRDASVTITPPAGWTAQAPVVQAAGSSSRQQIFYRVASGAEPASYTWVFSAPHAGAAGAILSYSGVDTAAPIDASGGNTTPRAGDTNLQHRALGVTSATVDTMVLSAHSFASSATWTAPAGMTERVDIASQGVPSTNGVSLGIDEVAQASVGATGDKIATASGNGDTGVAQLVVLRPLLRPPVLELTTDEASWSGAPGEVADSSGNGLNGRSFNGASTAAATPAIAGNPGTCRYGAFDGSDDYVEVANNALLDISDELTVMVWVRANSLPTAGSLKSIASKDTNYEFHLNSAGQVNWWWGGGALELTSAGSVPTGSWTHIAIVYSRSGGYQRIYLDGVQDPNTNNQTGALPSNALPLQVGADQNFAGRYFDGDIDEVRVFHQALGPGRIAQYMNATRPCAALVDHYSIGHAGSGVACVDQTITITAHDASHAAVDAGGATIALSTSSGKGSWVGIVGGGGALTDATPGDGAATYTFAAGSQSVQLAFRYANLAAGSETFGFNATDGGHSEATGGAVPLVDDPSFTLVQSGFQFRNVTDGNTIIPAQIAGKPSNSGFNARTVRLQAVRTDTATGSCVGLFASQTRTVQLGAECNNPGACAGRLVQVNGTAVPTSNDNAGAGAAAYGNVSLAFNASSEADTVIRYPDAGQISLYARYDLDPAIAGFEMQGSSNAFVVRPFGIAFSGMGHANAANGSVFAAAGDNFAMTLAAYQWAAGEDANNDGVPDAAANITDNGTTPNFAATANVAAAANLAGAAGSLTRGAACTNPASIALVGGTATANDWCYSEVGNVLLSATAPNYLGSGQDVTGMSGLDGVANGPYVGRFRPKHFTLSSASLTTRSDVACAPASSFTYMDETLRLGFTLTARNAQNATTQNYSGSYAKLNPASFAAWGFAARSGAVNLTSRIDPGVAPGGSWSNGAVDVTVDTAILRASPDAPDGPYAGLQFGIAPVDADGTAMNTLDLDVDGAGGNDHKSLGIATEVRFGRLRIENALGPEASALPIPIRTEYWTGSGFATNAADSCTSLARSAIALDFTPPTNLAACETRVQQATIAFASGVGTLSLGAPGAGNDGAVLLTANLGSAAGSYCDAGGNFVAATAAAMPYLLGRWSDASDPDGSGGTSYDDKPSARAAFGLYSSQPKNFIYFRENY